MTKRGWGECLRVAYTSLNEVVLDFVHPQDDMFTSRSTCVTRWVQTLIELKIWSALKFNQSINSSNESITVINLLLQKKRTPFMAWAVGRRAKPGVRPVPQCFRTLLYLLKTFLANERFVKFRECYLKDSEAVLNDTLRGSPRTGDTNRILMGLSWTL